MKILKMIIKYRMLKKVLRRRRGLKKRYMRKRRSARRTNSNNVVGGPNTCKVIETIPSIAIANNTPYLINKAGITGTRASAIAQQFGLYRIAKVIFTYRPVFDTYSPGIVATGSNPAAVPTLYWKVNRYGDFPAAFNGDYMRALGAKPNRLDDKNVVFSYKPNILVAQNNQAGTTTSGVKMTPWLSTDDTPADNLFTLSTALHYGHSLFVEGATAGSGTGKVADMDVRIVYEFKNPRVISGSHSDISNANPVPLQL